MKEVFRTNYNLDILLRFKNSVEKKMHSAIVYQYT